MTKQTGAKAVQEGAIGHNKGAKDELTKKYVAFVAEKEAKIKILRNQIKEEMVSAKDDGCDATAIRKAAKLLAMSDEQRTARDEELAEIERITELCVDLPIFAAAKKDAA